MSEPRELNEDDIEKLRGMLRSSAWNDVMKPALIGRLQVLIGLLTLDPSARGEKGQSDETIRGMIQQVNWSLTRFDQVIEEFDHNRRLDTRDAELATTSP